MTLQPGQRVEVLWDRLGWMPGVFEYYTAPMEDEEAPRCWVRMDSGATPTGCGFHPDCVRALVRNPEQIDIFDPQ